MRQALETLQELPAITYLIPMTLIIVGFLIGAWAIYFDYRKRQLAFEERRLMIERGLTPPPEPEERAKTPAAAWATKWRLDHEERMAMIEKGLTPPPPKRWTRSDYLRIGLIALFAGLGLSIGGYLFLSEGGYQGDAGIAGAWGVAIAAIGLGCVVYALVAKGHESEERATKG
jgi:hypothetical protein